MIFKTLNLKEEKEFRQWARDNFKEDEPINGLWHPVVVHEMGVIMQELHESRKEQPQIIKEN